MKKFLKNNKYELLFLLLLLGASFCFYYEMMTSVNHILIHGDFKYALTVSEHIAHHFNNLCEHPPKILFLSILYIFGILFSDIFAEKLFTVFILWLSLLFIYFAHKYFIQKIYDKKNKLLIQFSAFLGTVIFLFNPWTINKFSHHYWLVLSLAASYLLITEVDKLINSKKNLLKRNIWIAFLFFIIATQVQSLIIYFFPMIALYFLMMLLRNKKIFLKKLISKKIILCLTVVILLNFIWIFPAINTIFSESSTPSSYGMVEENVDMLSRRAIILNIFQYASGWIWGAGHSGITYFDIFYNEINVWTLMILSIIIIATSSLFFSNKYLKSRKQKDYFVYFNLLFFFSIIFSSGSKLPVIGDLYKWLFLNFPLGWAIRDPYKNVGLVVISLGFLYISSFLFFQQTIKKGKMFLVRFLGILFIIPPIIWGWPILTGNLNGNLTLVEYPIDLITTINNLHKQENINEHNILWYSKGTSELSYGSIPQLSSNSFNLLELQPSLKNHIDTVISNEGINELKSIFEKLGIKYIVLRSDFNNKYEDQLKTDIATMTEIEKMFNQEFILRHSSENWKIYKIDNPKQMLSIAPRIVSSSNLNFSKMFKYNSPFVEFINPLLDNNLTIISSDYNSSVINKYLIKTNSEHHNPKKYWSLGSFSGSWLNSINPYFKKFELENWQFDFEKGLVFTWSPAILKEKISFETVNLIEEFNFEKNECEFKSLSLPIINISLDEKSKSGLSSLMAKISEGDNQEWKVISSDFINLKENNYYKISMFMSGKDIDGLHTKIFYYNRSNKKIDVDFISSGTSKDFDFKDFEKIFRMPKGATKAKIQIWTLQNEEKESYYWIDDMKIYDLNEFTEPNILEIPFKIKESDYYHLFIRNFQNEKGGEIGISLDKKEIKRIQTEDQLNEFVWQEIAQINLDKGKHKLILDNIDGFNAVNLFALIPEKEYQNLEQETDNLVRDKRLIYILEAESDIYRENALKSNKFKGKASNGEVLQFLPNSKTWQEIEIPRDGNYRMALKLKGSFEIKINNQIFQANSEKLDFVYLDQIYLKKGKHKIEINPLKIHDQIKWNFDSEEDLIKWRETNPENQFDANQQLTLDNKYKEKSLKTELFDSTWGWKTINSPLVSAEFGNKYKWNFKIRGEDSHGVHTKMIEYDKDKNYLSASYLKGIGENASFDWKDIEIEFEPTNKNTSYLQLQVWHGHETNKPLPNIIWLDEVETYGGPTSYLDVIWLYSTKKENETLEDIFKVDKIPAVVSEFEKINPTKYRVKVKADEPFMLSFAENYNSLWVAYINDKEYEPIPLYSIINGFWIDETGDLDITIEYKPQRWFYIGALISGTTLFLCLGYLVWDWRRRRKEI
ncbi:MAG: hypothetical protein KAQ87_03110 [Candidatus Pacebacteria bacterium]|nr:hypothetical protein [Candidatus Paceibacterota bacterium]